jgi:hypothetical protein
LLPLQYWAAQPYTAPQNRPAGSDVTFGLATALPDRTFYNAQIDWRRAELLVRHTNATADSINNNVSTGPEIWQHDPHYRSRPATSASNSSNSSNGTSIGTENVPPAGSISTGTLNTTPGTNGQQISTQPIRPQRR